MKSSWPLPWKSQSDEPFSVSMLLVERERKRERGKERERTDKLLVCAVSNAICP